MTLFKKKNYSVAISIGLPSPPMHPVKFVFDTGSRPNLLRVDMIEPDRMSSVRISREPWLQSAIGRKAKLVGTIMLYIIMKVTHSGPYPAWNIDYRQVRRG